MRFNSLMLISNDEELAKKIAKEVWKYNTNWTVISVTDCFDYNFKKYISENKTLIVSDGECFRNTKPNNFIKYCDTYKILPIFISTKNNENSLPHEMYMMLEDIYLDTLEYIHDDRDISSYDTLISIIKNYIW